MKWIERWYVRSFSNSEKEYTVSLAEDGETFGCSCPAWTFQRHRIRDGICKHIRQIQSILQNEDMHEFEKHYPNNITHDDFFTEEEFTL